MVSYGDTHNIIAYRIFHSIKLLSYHMIYGRFPNFHCVLLGRDPGTLKSDIVSKEHPQLICSDWRLSNRNFEDWNYGNRPYSLSLSPRLWTNKTISEQPSPWRSIYTYTYNMQVQKFFETLKFKFRRLKLWKPTVQSFRCRSSCTSTGASGRSAEAASAATSGSQMQHTYIIRCCSMLYYVIVYYIVV